MIDNTYRKYIILKNAYDLGRTATDTDLKHDRELLEDFVKELDELYKQEQQ